MCVQMSVEVGYGDNDAKSAHIVNLRIASDAKVGRDCLLDMYVGLTNDKKNEMDAAWLAMCEETKTILTMEQVCAVAVSSLCKINAPHGYVAALIEFAQPTWCNHTLSAGVRFHLMHMFTKLNESAFVKKASSSSSSASNATKPTKSKRAIKNKKRAHANRPPVGEIQSVDD